MLEKPQVEEQLRTRMRRLGMARRTEESYVGWYKRHVKYHGMRHPAELGMEGVEAFPNHLAMHLEVAALTQNQAFSALLFLCKEVPEIPLEDLGATRAKRKRKVPMVLSREEMRAVLREAKPRSPRTLLGLLYG